MSEGPLHVAIVGGGLCGLALAIALTRRKISFTIYEVRSSFTEIGAGINIGPNAYQAFKLIDPVIADALFGLATRNAPGEEDIWMKLCLGAPTDRFQDGHNLHSLLAPPTGNMTTSRNELLQLLANSIDMKHARFNKKLLDICQDDQGVTISFEDRTQNTASLIIGCDGAHSTMRRLLLGADHPATAARFSHTGGYRAVFPMHVFQDLVGKDTALCGNLWVGPNGYVIMYPIDGGSNVNVGLWPSKPGDWEHEAWVLPDQKQEMLKDFAGWGPITRRVMGKMANETAFWATFHHIVKPEHYFEARFCMIGDASHAMSPHQGQGAAQSMEDACVMAEVLAQIDSKSAAASMVEQIQAAFSGYEYVRKPRFEKVMDSSIDTFNSLLSKFWRPDLKQQDMKRFQEEAEQRWRWIWDSDIEGQGLRAKAEMRRILDERVQGRKETRAKLS